MALKPDEKELAAVGISVAAGCRPCTSYHLKEVRKTRATEAEIRQAVVDAVCVRNSATESMRRHGLELGDADGELPGCGCSGETTRIGELVSIGAAFAVNCSANLAKHLQASQTVGVTEDDVAAIAELAAFIKKMAASHVERVVGQTEPAREATSEKQAEGASCC
jgi:AhpD family alkylhydroperoxidase